MVTKGFCALRLATANEVSQVVAAVEDDDRRPYVFRAGDGATYQIGSDFYPYTVRRVSAGGKTLWATRDQARHGSFFLSDDAAKLERFSLRKTGQWRKSNSCGTLSPGRRLYLDPSF